MKFKGGTVSLVPHIQGSKEAKTSGDQIVASVDECQQMYNEVRHYYYAHPPTRMPSTSIHTPSPSNRCAL